MLKRLSKRFLSVLLALCLIVSVISVGMVGANAGVGGFFAEKAAEKLLELGIRAASTGLTYLSEATGDEEGEWQPFSLLNDWLFKSPEECALDELYELCEEILREISEMDAKMSESFAFMEAYMAESEINSAKKTVNDQWAKDVDDVVSYAKATDALKCYQQYLSDAVAKKDQSVIEADQQALLYAYFAMTGKELDIGDYSDVERIKEEMFTKTTVNTAFVSLIGELASNLTYNELNSGSVALYASQFAYKYFPFSHQQYQYLQAIMGMQILTLIEVEMMYNEYLFQQGEYIEEHSGLDSSDYSGYMTCQRQFNSLMTSGENCVDSCIEQMLSKQMIVDNNGSVKLSLADYMKPEDAQITTLTISDYSETFDAFNAYRKANNCETYLSEDDCRDGSNISNKEYINSTVKFQKVMTHTANGSKVYYIIDPEQFRGTDALYVSDMCHCIDIKSLSDWHTESCDFNNLCKPMSDGVNTYSMVSDEDCTGLQELFATNYFSARNSKPQDYLNGYVYYLPTFGDGGTNPSANRTFIASSRYKYTYKSAGTDWTHFYVIDANEQFTGGTVKSDYDMYSEDWENSQSAAYSIILKNDSSTFKQKVSAVVTSPSLSDMKITTDGIHLIDNGESMLAESGKELTILMNGSQAKLKSLKLTRSNTEQTTQTLLEEDDFANLPMTEEGYYIFRYPMPYSDATLTLEADENTRKVFVETSDNGKAVFENNLTYDYCTIGETCVVYASPDDDCTVHSVYLMETDSETTINDIPVTLDPSQKRRDGEDAYSFTMPSRNVRVRVNFVAGSHDVILDPDSFVYDDDHNPIVYMYFVDDPEATSRAFAPGYKVNLMAEHDPNDCFAPAVTATGMSGGKVYDVAYNDGVYSFDMENEDVFVTATYSHHNYVNGICTVCGDYEIPELNDDGFYELKNAGNFLWFAALVNDEHEHADFEERNAAAKAVMIDDIDLENRGFNNIGLFTTSIYSTVGAKFSGVFDGQGHTLNNFYADGSYNRRAMFGNTENAEICNVTVKGEIDTTNFEMENYETLLGLISMVSGNVKVHDVTSYIDITSTDDTAPGQEAGGIAAIAQGSVTIERCVNFGSIIVAGFSSKAAGIIAETWGNAKIRDCANLGALTSSNGDTAGIITKMTYSNNSISNCYNYGELTAGSESNASAIALSTASYGTAENCYYLEGTASEKLYPDNVTVHTAEQFKSGETGYKLNSGVNDGTEAWYQNIDNGKTPDDYPLPDKTRGTIYFIENEKRYSNFPDGHNPEEPTEAPTEAPTQAPTEAPTQEPTQASTEAPTDTPYTPTLYTATIEEMIGGTASFSADSIVTEKQFEEYEMVEFLVTAPKGYTFSSLSVTDSKGNDVDYNRTSENQITDDTITYTIGFRMPPRNVTIKGSLTEGFTAAADSTQFVLDGSGSPIAYIELMDYANNSVYTTDPIVIAPYMTTVRGRFVYDDDHYPTHLKVVGVQSGTVFYDMDQSATATEFLCMTPGNVAFGENILVIPTFAAKTEPSEPSEHGIRNYEELCEFAQLVNSGETNANAYLENNILAPEDSQWTLAIGTADKPYNGTFDGKGYCIVGLNLYNTGNAGLFEKIGSSGVVKDLMVFDCRSREFAQYAGGIAAINEGTIDHCTSGINLAGNTTITLPNGNKIKPSSYNSYANGRYSGGIAAVNKGTITGSRNGAVVGGTYCGGITAVNEGRIYGSANNGAVGSSSVSCLKSGGIAGENKGEIYSSYNSGKPYCGDSTALGMLAGVNSSDDIDDVFYSDFNDISVVGSSSTVAYSDTSGLMKNTDMKLPQFVDTLNSVTDSTVTWIQTKFKDSYFNQGFPTIEGRYLNERMTALNSVLTVSGMMHDDLSIDAQALSEASEEYAALAAQAEILSAFSVSTTDADGRYVPAELWTSGGLQLTVSLGDLASTGADGDTAEKHLALLVQNEDGTIIKIAPDSVNSDTATFTVGELRNFAVAMTSACPLGDADGDGKVTSIDAAILQRFDAKINTAGITGDDLLARADVDGDGKITIIDVTLIQRYLANMNVQYPIGEYPSAG